MIDGVTLTDTVTRLFKAGKTSNVPVLGGSVNDEGGAITSPDVTLTVADANLYNLTDAQIEKIISWYPVNGTFGVPSQGNFFLTDFKAYFEGLASYGDPLAGCSERMVGKYMSDAHGQSKVWTFRFNAPGEEFRRSNWCQRD